MSGRSWACVVVVKMHTCFAKLPVLGMMVVEDASSCGSSGVSTLELVSDVRVVARIN